MLYVSRSFLVEIVNSIADVLRLLIVLEGDLVVGELVSVYRGFDFDRLPSNSITVLILDFLLRETLHDDMLAVNEICLVDAWTT